MPASAPRPGEAEALAKLGLQARRPRRSRGRGAVRRSSGPRPVDEKGRPLAPADVVGDDHLWWLDRMMRTTAPLIERMTLIWHSWFATSNQGVASQQLMLNQNELFRGNALGSFSDLLTGVTTGSGDAHLAERQPEREEPPERELRPRDDGALHARRRPRRLHRDRRPREGPRAHRLERVGVNKGVHRRTFVFNPTCTTTRTRRSSAQTGNYAWQDSCNLCLNHPLHPSFFVDEALELLRPDAARRGHVDRRSQALYVGPAQIHPVVEAILQHPDFYSSPRMVKPPVVSTPASCG